MAVAWTLNGSVGGTRRASSIEYEIWDGEGTSVSTTTGRALGAGRRVPQQSRTSSGRLEDDFKAASLQTHFWVRNAPYAVNDRGNSLKSQQMRPPSERTINPRLASKSLTLITAPTSRARGSIAIPISLIHELRIKRRRRGLRAERVARGGFLATFMALSMEMRWWMIEGQSSRAPG